jgi:hypothetical protein
MEHRSDPPPAPTETEVGAQPPRIEDLLPPPSSPVAIARGLGSGHTTTFTTHVQDDPASRNRTDLAENIPDFGPGRAGDGTGVPSDSHSDDRQRRQKDTLDKLRIILAWYVLLLQE